MRLAPLVAALALSLLVAPARAEAPSQLSPTTLGLNGVNLAGGVESAAVPLVVGTTLYDQVTWDLTVTKGSSSTMTVTCKGSVDGSTFHAIQRCSGDAVHVCTARTWSYDLTTQTTFVLNVPARYVAMKCTFTASGTGSLVARATRTVI